MLRKHWLTIFSRGSVDESVDESDSFQQQQSKGRIQHDSYYRIHGELIFLTANWETAETTLFGRQILTWNIYVASSGFSSSSANLEESNGSLCGTARICYRTRESAFYCEEYKEVSKLYWIESYSGMFHAKEKKVFFLLVTFPNVTTESRTIISIDDCIDFNSK